MVTFRRKAAERNPASTAALRRVAISLNQRRALRHPAGASKAAAMTSPVSLKKRIREEVMNGTFSQKAEIVVSQSFSLRIADFPLRSRGTVRGRCCVSRAGGRRAPRTSLQACYDLRALPCPKYLVVSHRGLHFSAHFFFGFALPSHSRAMNPPNIALENLRAASRPSWLAIK